MPQLYLGLGSNLGDKAGNLRNAIDRISRAVGPLCKQSDFFASKPWGYRSPNDFLNAVICVETGLSPGEALQATQDIERTMGRSQKSPTAGYADRIIDIDLLFYDDLLLATPELTLPHPLIEKRDFVLLPLCQIAPRLKHPRSGKTIAELCAAL